eukprot:TRINITY_DN1633_c0_g1_i2.p1 TRINITY_DN1633_c0_g1~~TRINITY_DN1633_c0_g1_i2.p1  ORF type:complete len:237 (+),score=21.07 TRINITY_DN1633_c0_g1_i2:63-773(+)
MTSTQDKIKRWLPLESNPSVLNKFAHKLGMPRTWEFGDVFGVDSEMLAWVPKPVLAVVLLFPITEKSEKHKAQEEESFATSEPSIPSDVYFTKQYVGNACGTIALIHAVANNTETLGLNDGPLRALIDSTRGLTPQERGRAIEDDVTLEEGHVESSQEGQSAVPDDTTSVDLHFICLTRIGDTLYELDGRKERPIPHGATTADTVLEDSARVVREFMARDPENLNFNMLVLRGAES